MARPRFVGLVLALVTLLVYLPVRRHSFVLYDDPNYITENRVVQAGLTWSGVKWAAVTWRAQNWHPLAWVSHMLDCQLFGLDAGAHHLVNVLFHTANAVLLLALLLRLTGALWPAALVAALFAWHPLHVESVAWAAERKDVLSTLFWLLSILAYVRYVEGAKVRSPKSEVRSAEVKGKIGALPSAPMLQCPEASAFRYYLLSLGMFALGLMAKPMLVTLPFLLLVLDFWPLKRSVEGSGPATFRIARWKRLIVEKWPFFLLSGASCVITFLAQRAEAVVDLEPYPLGPRLANALVSYGRYLLKMVWPADLAVVYPLQRQWPWIVVAASAALLVGVSWACWRTRRQRPHLLAGWLWYLGTLVPVIGLVQVGGQAMADRYTYVPLIGIFLALTLEAQTWVARLGLRPIVPGLAAGLLLAGCLFATERQLSYWQDSESLFAHAVAVTESNAVAHVNLGVSFEQQGRLDQAMKEYETALRFNPLLAHVHNNLGNLLSGLGKTNEALARYNEALRLKPSAPLAHDNLGTLLVKLGRYKEAMGHYTQAAQLDPSDPRPHYLMGRMCLRQGRSAEALTHFRDALRLDANDPYALTYLARVLAADEDPRLRNGPEAAVAAERANELTGASWPFVLDTLAMAYAEAGRFEEARQALIKAVDQAAAVGEADAVAAMRERSRLYEAKRPYREAFTNLETELQKPKSKTPR